jgi:hypothetical protein
VRQPHPLWAATHRSNEGFSDGKKTYRVPRFAHAPQASSGNQMVSVRERFSHGKLELLQVQLAFEQDWPPHCLT